MLHRLEKWILFNQSEYGSARDSNPEGSMRQIGGEAAILGQLAESFDRRISSNPAQPGPYAPRGRPNRILPRLFAPCIADARNPSGFPQLE
jgi:hypothetical protein